jgi:hypothetical protein
MAEKGLKQKPKSPTNSEYVGKSMNSLKNSGNT